jgi:hypothetical protein
VRPALLLQRAQHLRGAERYPSEQAPRRATRRIVWHAVLLTRAGWSSTEVRG